MTRETPAAPTTLAKFLHMEAVSGAVLLLAAIAALLWSNSPLAPTYEALRQMPVTVGAGKWTVSQSLHFWINDGLMTLFFLVVGMEIRRELHEGALRGMRQAALPVAAALGGVLVPAVIFLLLTASGAQRNGWAVPTATDIAFAVGVLALLGKGVPGNLRVILLALAIIDDVIAVSIIAIFYSGGLSTIGLAIAGLGVVLVAAFRRAGIASAWFYTIPGAVLWFGLLKAGIHPTLAGVALGLMTPVVSQRPDAAPPVVRIQRALHPWVAFGVMPLFALANAGVVLNAGALSSDAASNVLIGVTTALALGKPLGVVLVIWCVVKLGWCTLPQGVNWDGVLLVGLLTGIGFTMSIFIAMLAYADPALLDAAKLGVLLGSLLAALLGLAWGVLCLRRKILVE